MPSTFDSIMFRRVLSYYPTGVCAITAMPEGHPVGLAIGSFTSVSLQPPLVGFFPDRSSTSWPMIAAEKRFCVNVLAADQHDVCRALSAKGPDKFAGISYRLSPMGLPIVEGCLAWIDCDLRSAHEAGDHFAVLGAVRDLGVNRDHRPLLFFQGGYGEFVAL